MERFAFDANALHTALAAMELPGEEVASAEQVLRVHIPGGLGDVMQVADGGSWVAGQVLGVANPAGDDVHYVAIA